MRKRDFNVNWYLNLDGVLDCMLVSNARGLWLKLAFSIKILIVNLLQVRLIERHFFGSNKGRLDQGWLIPIFVDQGPTHLHSRICRDMFVILKGTLLHRHAT